MKKLARRIKLYSKTPFKPTRNMSPIIFDQDKGNLFIYPDGGHAEHYQLYDLMEEKGLEWPDHEYHGYYYPLGNSGLQHPNFQWYDSFGAPDDVLEGGILTAIKTLTGDKPVNPRYQGR